MHEIEPTGFCTIKEYKRSLEKRKQAEEISIGGLYMILAALKGKTPGKEAFKFPVIAKDLKKVSLQVATVTVNFLDVDLQPVGEVSFKISDGLARNPGIQELSTRQSVREMYVKDYDDYLPDNPGESSVAEGTRQLELIGA